MDLTLKYVLENLLVTRTDLFGKGNSFICFNEEEKQSKCKGTHTTMVFGRMLFYQKQGTTKLSKPLAIKITRENNSLEFYQLSAISNEIFLYSKILPFFDQIRHVGHLFPYFYGSHTETGGNGVRSIIVTENLRPGGYANGGDKLFLDYEHLALLARKLGEFHAYSYKAKKLEPFRFRCLAESLSDNNSKFVFALRDELDIGKWLRPALEMLQNNPRYSSKLENLDRFMEQVKESLWASLNPNRNDDTLVLCHGNFCSANALFKYENETLVNAKIINSADCALSTPALDLVWLLYSSADQKIRTERWDDLMNEYYAALQETFPDNEVPKMESIREGIRKKLIFAGIRAIVYAAFNDATEWAEKTNVSFRDVIHRIDLKNRMDILMDMIDRGGV